MPDYSDDDLFQAMNDGDESSRDRLQTILYRELHSLAQGFMRREPSGSTLQPTALVNEAWLRLSGAARPGADRDPRSERRYFFGAAAEAMRRVLVDRARARNAEKRGGRHERVTFRDLDVSSPEPAVDLLALDEALDALAAFDMRLAEVVKLRYYVQLDVAETAEVLGVSAATIVRDWRYARAWLQERLGDGSA